MVVLRSFLTLEYILVELELCIHEPRTRAERPFRMTQFIGPHRMKVSIIQFEISSTSTRDREKTAVDEHILRKIETAP